MLGVAKYSSDLQTEVEPNGRLYWQGAMQRLGAGNVPILRDNLDFCVGSGCLIYRGCIIQRYLSFLLDNAMEAFTAGKFLCFLKFTLIHNHTMSRQQQLSVTSNFL